jgi:topoisomerase-4 subunit B
MMDKKNAVRAIISFYMGKNTPDRQEFIIKNLKVDLDVIEEQFNGRRVGIYLRDIQ